MQITLHGTGAAEGIPGLFCDCALCQEARARGGREIRTRHSASIDGRLKIDFPPDTLYHSHRDGFTLANLPALVFTHGHDDHFAIRELQYLQWMFVEQVRAIPLQVFGSATVVDRLNEAIDSRVIPLATHRMEPFEPIQWEDFTITGFLPHHDPSQVCFNLVIQQGGKALLYATDTGWYSDETWMWLESQKLDGAVIEATKGNNEGGYEGHLSINGLLATKQRLQDCGALSPVAPVVSTHHSHMGGLLYRDIRELLEPHGVIAGYDGMVFSF